VSTHTVADDYAGPFDPDWSPARLSRAALARLAREVMLLSMYHDRALMPHIAIAHGQDATIAHADAEWMGASPIYTTRNKANLGIAGDGVAEALKSFQFDIGAPHHFLDFRFEVVDHDLGSFWLPFCGAHDYLRELSRNDPAMVTNMCHHMEDRTFDATLSVTNPNLRAIPVHRPPKPDEFTGDHCRWEVRVLADAPGAAPGEPTDEIMWSSAVAGFGIPLGESREPGGLDDYAGEFRPDLRLEDFSHAVLVRQVTEFAIDIHLLMRAAYLSVDTNFSPELLDEAAPQHLAAMAPQMVRRIGAALGIVGDDADAIAKHLQVDPLLPDEYLRYGVAVDGPDRLRLWVEPSAGVGDDVCRSPLSWLHEPDRPGFEHLAQAVNARACVRPLDPATIDEGPAELAWEIVIDPEAEPVAEHWAAEMVAGGEIARIDLTARPETPVIIGG